MKKKIINGIMMVALVAATSTSFVSCKDTNEDVRIEQAAEIAALQGRLTDLENKYGDLEGRVTALREKLNDTVDRVDLLEIRVDELEDWLQEAFAKLITGVEINGSWNNMTGMVELGQNANMLIANYGTAGKTGQLPVKGKLADGEKALDWNAGDKFGYDEASATYAGTIYATINKYLNGDFALAKDKFGAQLVTTSGKNIDDYVTIALGNDGKPTDKDLTWGWTRADNNVYEFEVGIKGNPEKLGFNILKIEGLKDDIKTVLNNRQHTTAQEFAQAAAKLYYTAVQGGAGSNLPKYALRIGWSTGMTDKQIVTKGAHTWTSKDFMSNAEHFVQSDANLLLATIKPLSFTTNDVPVSVTPKVQMTLDQAEKIFNRMVASVNSVVNRLIATYKGMNKGGNYEDYTLSDLITKSIVSEGNLNTNGNIIGVGANPALTAGKIYYVAKGGVNGIPANQPQFIYVLQDVPMNGLAAGDARVVSLNEYFAEYLSARTDEINRAIELVQEAQIYATNGALWKNKVADRSLNYSVKVDKWLGENFNHALQPTLFAIHNVKDGSKILQTLDTTDATLNRVSGVKGAPLAVKGYVILKPTSYTLETFCPIMAKFVTVTEIDGKAITPAEAEALSMESSYVVKFGHISKSYIDQYAFTPEKGKTYTILYEAVDYFGNTFSKEYYIKGE